MIVDDPHLHLRLAASEVDLLAARRLRYAVFVEELGGDGPLVDHGRRLEQDGSMRSSTTSSWWTTGATRARSTM
jgi:putative hemolysin